jgi:phosphoglycerol transferase
MKSRLLDNENFRRASLYITAALLSALIICFFFKIWRADLRVPFFYSGDSIFYSMFIRTTLDYGSYWQNPAIGAPSGLQLYDFPGLDNSVAIIVLLFRPFTHDAILVLNLFYLLTFPLITVATLYVFRQFNLSFVPSLFGSLLYTFLPYHFMRNETHILLSAYYVVPLAALVVLWVGSEELLVRTRKFVLSVLICLLLGSSGIYYPFFLCYLLLIAGATGSFKVQKVRPLVTAFALIGITCATIVVNLSPSVIYKYRYGDAKVVVRSPGEAERYGLKISQLLLPVTGHRINRLDQIKRFHNANTVATESDTSSLGFIASMGFLALLVQLLHRKELIRNSRGLFQDLSIFNVFAVLLGVVGGFAFLFAVLISDGIRSYNRISTYIAFFSLMAVVLGVESMYQRITRRRGIFYALVVVAFIVGFLDQTIPQYVPDYKGTTAEFFSDAEFVHRIETAVPPASMIFQLPYVPFPEHPGFHKMHAYDHLRGYLNSKNLRWSYGTMKNREGDRAQARVAAMPTEEFVQTLAFGGFSGIYLDRDGYEDGGAAKEAELVNVIQTQPLRSPNGRLLFFNLTDYGKRLREKYPDAEWQKKQELSFHPLLLDWKGGFSELESRPGKNWHWCSSEGELQFNNMSKLSRTVRLEMLLATGHPELDDFIISGLISEQLKVNSTPQFYSKTITAPPGESVLNFRSTAKRVDAPGDPRCLVFRIEDFKLTEFE